MVATSTAISWTDRTWNPIRGCSLVSAGCTHCYAMRQAGRFSGSGHPYEGLVRNTSHGYTWTGEVRLIEKDLDAPLHWKKPSRVFVASMSDPFHEHVPDAWLDRMFAVMIEAPHTFQVLTKRPERMCQYVTRWLGPTLQPSILDHIWLGVSVENQATAGTRIPWLLQTPGVVRFVSYEPALGAVDFTRMCLPGGSLLDALSGCWMDNDGHPNDAIVPTRAAGVLGLDWIIIGGESGPNARPFYLPWADTVIQQCATAGVAVWMKQLGRNPYTTPDMRYKVQDRAGADLSEWPAALRIQQFPRQGIPLGAG